MVRLLPVAERELRVSARRRGTYWTRFGGAAAAVAAASVVLLATLRERADERSQALFLTLSGLAFFYCLVSGILTTSDCVSEEKRDGTLGLLFLTDLRGYDVVTGKMIASSVRALSSLAAMVPVIGLPLMMGGVPGDAVGRIAMVLFNTMFLSLALGVVVSVVARDARHAIGGTLFAVVVLVVLLPLVRWVAQEYLIRPASGGGPVGVTQWFGSLQRPLDWMLLFNPVLLLFSAIQSLFGGGPRAFAGFWAALAAQHALAWMCLVAAFVSLPRLWQDRVEPTRSKAGVSSSGRPDGWREVRSEVLEGHPFAWMVVRERKAWWFTWLGLGVIGLGWLWGFWEVREDWLEGFVGLFTLFGAGLWLKLRLASVACRHLHEHRRTGALELILCTPQQPRLLVRDNLVGLRQVIAPPLATVLAAAGLLLVAALGENRAGSDQHEMVAAFGAGLIILVLDLWAIAWMGIWQGARSRRYVRAYGWTVGTILVLPWALFVVSLVVVGVSLEVLELASSWDPGTMTLIVWWTILAAGVDGVVVTLARQRLMSVLHEVTAEGAPPVAPGVGRVPPPEGAPVAAVSP